jgi:hypothetical protein
MTGKGISDTRYGDGFAAFWGGAVCRLPSWLICMLSGILGSKISKPLMNDMANSDLKM